MGWLANLKLKRQMRLGSQIDLTDSPLEGELETAVPELERVMSEGELEEALVAKFQKMKQDVAEGKIKSEVLHSWCLYFWNALDDPAVAIADITYRRKQKALIRKLRETKQNIWYKVLQVVGLLAGVMITSFVTSLLA